MTIAHLLSTPWALECKYKIERGEKLIELVQIALAALAAWQDVKTDRISNRLILLGMSGGLIYQIAMKGPQGFISYLACVLIPVILFYPLYYHRVIGAGDIKLFSMIGSYSSCLYLVSWMGISFLAGAVLSLCVMIKRGIFWERLQILAEYAKYSITYFPNSMSYQEYAPEGTKVNQIHFAIPMLLGLICCWVLF